MCVGQVHITRVYPSCLDVNASHRRLLRGEGGRPRQEATHHKQTLILSIEQVSRIDELERMMGLAFLPWERLPAWLVGLLLIAAGVACLREYKMSAGYVVAGSSFMVGGSGLFYQSIRDFRKKRAESKATVEYLDNRQQ